MRWPHLSISDGNGSAIEKYTQKYLAKMTDTERSETIKAKDSQNPDGPERQNTRGNLFHHQFLAFTRSFSLIVIFETLDRQKIDVPERAHDYYSH